MLEWGGGKAGQRPWEASQGTNTSLSMSAVLTQVIRLSIISYKNVIFSPFPHIVKHLDSPVIQVSSMPFISQYVTID